MTQSAPWISTPAVRPARESGETQDLSLRLPNLGEFPPMAGEPTLSPLAARGPRARLQRALTQLPPPVRRKLERFDFDELRFLRLAELHAAGALPSNRATGDVEPLASGELAELPPRDSEEGRACIAAGEEALARGECALIVLAGGMATRMGGLVKALVLAHGGSCFLDYRLADHERLLSDGARPRLWWMTSAATHDRIQAALAARLSPRERERVAVFPQSVSLRLDEGGELFSRDERALYAPGHGDLPAALRRSELLQDFLRDGGRYVQVTNVDNLGAALDPLLVGFHLRSERPLTCEVVDKNPGDRGGIPVRLDGVPQVLEEFRLPRGFDASVVPVFNTNTFHFDAAALHRFVRPLTDFFVEKSVGDRRATQFERLLGEVTATLPTRFLRVPRRGPDSRFLPVKDRAELDLRQREIGDVLRARRLLP